MLKKVSFLIPLFIMLVLKSTTCSAEECPPQIEPTKISSSNPVFLRLNNATVNSANTLYINPEANRAMISMDELAAVLGYTYSWDPNSSTLYIVKAETELNLTVNAFEAQINATSVEVDSPVIIVDSKPIIPLRFVAESLGAKVLWNNKTRTIDIIYNKA